MNTPVAIVAQYLVSLEARTEVRPYQVREQLKQGVDLALNFAQLPEEHHWRVEMRVSVESKGEERLYMNVAVVLEAIAVAQAESPADAKAALTASVAPLLFATARAQIANATMTTGYGPLNLPPLPSEKLASLVPADA